MIVTIPIRIESTQNLRECWQARSKRTREHRRAAWWGLRAAKAPHAMPCVVTLTRIAPRALDSDNNVAGLKGARDGVADWLQADDADPRITWLYAQSKGKPKEYALQVEISC